MKKLLAALTVAAMTTGCVGPLACAGGASKACFAKVDADMARIKAIRAEYEAERDAKHWAEGGSRPHP